MIIKTDMIIKDDLIKVIKEKGIYRPKKDYYFGNLPGTRYAVQFYLTNIILDPEWTTKIGTALMQLNAYKDVQIAGMGWDSLPLITAFNMVSNYYGNPVNTFWIRDARKTYGRHNWVEGVPNGKPVQLIGSLTNSTANFARGAYVCESIGLEVTDVALGILNKYSRKEFGDEMEYDRYSDQRCVTILERDDLNA
jgi:hypothetical protein